jgi:hypothetical protein
MRRVVAGGVTALAVSLLWGSAAVAQGAQELYRFKVGGWDAAAFALDGTRRFRICAATASYENGTTIIFTVDRNYGWTLTLGNPELRLPLGQSYKVTISVDNDIPSVRTATAISANLAEIRLPATEEVFERFKRGRVLQVTDSTNRSLAFNLTDTSLMLPALLRCVHANLNPQPAAPTTAANPFVAAAPAKSGGTAKRRPPSYRAEAVAFAANILGAAGVTGFRILDESKDSDRDAIWVAPNTFGSVLIDAENPPSLISATTIALDSATCKSKFLSGAAPPDGNEKILRLFTKCGEGKDAVTVFYFVIPRKVGGHYLVGTGSVGTDEPARKTESDVRAAAFTLSGR